MDMNEYQRLARGTAIYPPGIGLPYTILGLVGEAGELANTYKKTARDDGGILSDERRARLIDELGDVLWYAAALAFELGVPLGVVAERNLRKLEDRQARGQLGGSGDER